MTEWGTRSAQDDRRGAFTPLGSIEVRGGTRASLKMERGIHSAHPFPVILSEVSVANEVERSSLGHLKPNFNPPMVCLGNLNETPPDGILRLLDTIFSDVAPEEKIAVIQDDFGIPVEPAMEREVNNMGGYGDVVFERGVIKGEVEATSKNIQALATNMNISLVEAMNLLGIPKADQQQYLDMLEPQCV